jgi:hypothetical protein
MINFFKLVVAITILIFCGTLAYFIGERKKLKRELNFTIEKLERFEKRYNMGDLEHTIEFEHTCGHKELFSLSNDQVRYLMQLKAHSCYDCNRRNEKLGKENNEL